MTASRFIVLGIVLALLEGRTPAAGDNEGEKVRFNRDIRPLLAENCFQCHGPDPGSRKAELRLDRVEGFFGKREEGPTVVRGNPEASPLFQRITHKDPDEVMPPIKSRKTLKAAEKELLRRWISEGAPWQPHWSFVKPVRPSAPPVKDERWARHPIDRFILARLEAAGLKPAAEADRRTLARRLSLDTTGLPPEPELVEAFVKDPAPDALEKLVDRLLESPRYGEHRARYWMDAARYADTHGLHFDNFREIWPYRDWVINAFNRNTPFDRFTVEQLAGDLLPQPTPDQIIATGFHRCAMSTNEGGSITEEVLASYARERVETTSWVWLGLTSNCAVCHDHKFDPITTRDFYSMSAYFRNHTQGAMDGNKRDPAPVLAIPKPDDEARWKAIPGEVEKNNGAVAERKKLLRAEFDAWLEKAGPGDAVAEIGAPDFLLPLEGTLKTALVTATAHGSVTWVSDGPLGQALVLDGKSHLEIGGEAGHFDRKEAFSAGCWVRASGKFQGSAAVLARIDTDNNYRGWDLYLEGKEVVSHIIHKWKEDAIKVATTGALLKPGKWQHLFVTYDGSGKAAGLKIYVDGQPAKLKVEIDALKGDPRTPAPFLVGQRKKGFAFTGAVQGVRLYRRRLSGGEVGQIAAEPKLRALLAQAPEARKPKDKDDLFAARSASDAEIVAAGEAVAKLEDERKKIRDRSPVTFIMEEKKGGMPAANILFRGEYDKPRDKVEAAVFSALHPLPAGAPKSRLGLAQWLVSPENPLTARVIVNRFWQEIFGTGLVKTSEDFGIMGEAPSHPELLDHLAVEFREGGYDVKKLIRGILVSATYRQSAAVAPEKIRKDPANRLLSRGPRFRMDAEMLRDYALAASGTLSEKLGGPSVRPYQPGGVWEAVAMPESNTRFYKPDTGEALYRRSLYTFWKRMAPPASMDILNAPAREVTCVRRERTNTPLQALVTLNDPQFVEAARALAQRGMKEGKPLENMALRVLARPLRDPEREAIEKIAAKLRAHYREKPEDAKALLAVGESKADASLDPVELATWTMTANQLLNLDEVLNK